MTTTVGLRGTIPHCCACSGVCHHIGGPWFCDSHKTPLNPTPFALGQDSAEVQRLRAENLRLAAGRDHAEDQLGDMRASLSAAEAERDRIDGEMGGVREELARMAGDLDDSQAERDRLRVEVKRLATLERMAMRHALQADKDRAEADAKVARLEADRAGRAAYDAQCALQLHDLTVERDAMSQVVKEAQAWRAARPGPWIGGTDTEFRLFTAVDALGEAQGEHRQGDERASETGQREVWLETCPGSGAWICGEPDPEDKLTGICGGDVPCTRHEGESTS